MAAKKKAAASPERHEFGAEVARLLEILVHSVYADREVFLRELISNASDACDKLRYLALSDGDLLGGDTELKIEIIANADTTVIEITDNGIGMSHDDLIENLGTIAKSGTRAFMEEAGGSDGVTAQVGQFGIGFYSAFIVAGHVEVT
ncbi:MAG: molecular chaperone HtpG, partial [Rhizobiales bacterium]|nr:molecular chaperone HtpG [Hyphomicrobiales bacterium]